MVVIGNASKSPDLPRSAWVLSLAVPGQERIAYRMEGALKFQLGKRKTVDRARGGFGSGRCDGRGPEFVLRESGEVDGGEKRKGGNQAGQRGRERGSSSFPCFDVGGSASKTRSDR